MNPELFSMEEFARLKNFANYAVEEDRRLHNIGNNNNCTLITKINIFI